VKVADPRQEVLTKELFGNGIFGVDGEEWRKQRKVASHMFSARVFREHMESVFLEHGKLVVDRLSKVKPNETIDMQDLFLRHTMDSICQIAFGHNLKSLLQKETPTFSRSFDRAQEIISARGLIPRVQFLVMKYLQLGWEKEFTRCIKTLRDFVGAIVKERASREETKEGLIEGDLLSQFITKARQDNEPFTEDQAFDIIMNFLIAGRDTTACLLTWTVYRLAKHPEMEAKVVKEFKDMLDREGATPSYEKVVRDSELPYTHAFLCEVLRIHPPVPSDSKVAKADDTLPDGTFIPKGSRINYMPYIFGRLESIWGPDAQEFKPERWLQFEKEPSQYKFLTFNAGPRLCLGKHMAFYETKMLLAMILPKFKFTIAPTHNPQYKVAIILQMTYGLPMFVTPRQGIDKGEDGLKVTNDLIHPV